MYLREGTQQGSIRGGSCELLSSDGPGTERVIANNPESAGDETWT